MKAKLIAIILFFSALLSAAPLYGQISVTFKDVPLMEALSTLENKSEYSFFYSNMLPDKDARVSIDARDKSIEFILDNIFSNLSISYEINGHQIVLREDKKEDKNTSYKASGVVIDSAGEPVIGAGVVIEGSTNGTITDVDGRWELVVPSTTTKIVISSLGYKEQVVAAGSASARTVTLHEDSQMLQETVVVGYGVQKKVNLTGAVAMVNSEEMNARPISSVASGLQGLLPGVTVVNSSSQPGQANTTIRVRGVGTIGNSNPLILIDGIEGDISSINPEDIESVSVLKDAASSAIYGARAANGVLLVTTKKLAAGKDAVTKINFSAYAGIQTPTRLPEMCDAIEFMTLDNEARKNVDTADAWLPEDFDKVRNNTDPNYFGNTDWIGQVIKKVAPQQNYSLSLNGTLGNSGYMLSYRYFDQSGLTVGNSTGETRHNLRFKINTKLIDRVTLSSNLGYTTTKVISPVSSLTSGGGAIYTAMRIAPNVPVRYTDGTWAYGGGNTNPVAILRDGGRAKTDADELSIMEVVKVDILKGWDVSATYNVTSYNGLKDILKKTITFNNPEDGSTYSYQSPNSIKNIDYRHNQQTFILQTNFDLNFGKHNVSGVVGMSQEWYTSRSFEASRTKLITEQDPTLNLGDPQTMSNASSYSSWAIRSGFGRVSYNWNERYLLEGNLRYDLSSRFHKSNRSGLFPSVSAGWRISEENFMAATRTYLDNLKIRASWGMLGNQYVGSSNYPYLSVLQAYTSGISMIGANATTGYVQSTLSNPNLSWEKIKMLDLGFDLAMFSNRLTFSFDWYNKDTDGILLKLNYPAQLGAKPSEQNAGKVNNKGWEMDLNWRSQAGEFMYGIGFNLSDVKNKIVDLGGNAPDLSGNQIRMVGYPIDAFYGYIADGLMTPEDFKINNPETHTYNLPNIPVILGNRYQPGDIKYKDLSGPEGVPDGRITPEYDRTVLGSSIPRYTYSVRGNLGWRGIDFSFVLQGVGKCSGYLEGSARHALQDMAAYPQKVHLERYNVVTNPNPKASYPRLTYNTGFNQNTFSTFWLEDASYLRVKNVQLGYTFPEKWMKKARIDNFRVYASADNLFTFSKFFYAYDPETPVSKGGYYPLVKTVVIGVNLTFK
ncbi:MAG: TonB-dependent receptor [Bacteroides sp.]|nr:TonB-dependent receptor [Bacteroides sp.]MDY2973946.1 TonB-dependent receptor [Candidatus Cryptobacteroides sp.]MED9900013.1 TonB-dependent receptor [Bacteroidales bacterium]